MAIRTVRLDHEAEATLRQIREATGLPISEVLRRGDFATLIWPHLYQNHKLPIMFWARNWVRRGHRYYPVEIVS